MKKSLIALAALASISAFAETALPAPTVTVYGLIDISYGRNSTTSTAQDDALLLHDKNSTSRVGLKGSTDAGGGVKVNFNLEAGNILIAAKPANEALFNRQAWAGFSGSFGEVRAGVQDSIAFQTNIGFDLNGAASDSQAAGLAGVPTLGNSAGTLAQYISPDFGGLKAQLGYMPKSDNVALTADAGAKAGYALGVSYGKGPFAAAVTFQSATTDTTTLVTSNNLSIASGSYDFGVAKLVGTYANGGKNNTGYNFGVAVPVLGASVGVQVAKNTDTNNTGVELFANKEVLKSMTAYLDVGKKHVDAGGDYDAFSLGLIWTF